MTDAYTTIRLLTDEIEGRIVALKPNGFPTYPFKLRPEDARRVPLIDSGGPARLFEIEGPDFTNDDDLVWGGGGGGIHNPAALLFINIIYPTTRKAWHYAAFDDADQIRADIRNNRATEPAGIEIRKNIDVPFFEKSPEDDWEVLTLPIWTLITVS